MSSLATTTTTDTCPPIVVVSDEEWVAARLELLESEKALSKAQASLAAKRRQLPWREIPDYDLVGASGPTKLSSLFGPSSQLLVYHMMMGKGSTQGCSLCSFFIDEFSSSHLYPRASFAVVAKAEFSNISSFVATKRGWDVGRFFSASASTFSENFGVSFTEEQMKSGDTTYNYNRKWQWGSEAPGISVFVKRPAEGEDGGGSSKIFHTYSTFSAGLGGLSSVLQLIDLTPEGRAEKEGGRNMFWVKHKEEYEAPTAKKKE